MSWGASCRHAKSKVFYTSVNQLARTQNSGCSPLSLCLTICRLVAKFTGAKHLYCLFLDYSNNDRFTLNFITGTIQKKKNVAKYFLHLDFTLHLFSFWDLGKTISTPDPTSQFPKSFVSTLKGRNSTKRLH